MHYLAQIGWHGLNVMTFRHRGEGLENCSKANCMTLIGISSFFVMLASIGYNKPALEVLVGTSLNTAYLLLAMRWFSARHTAGIACAVTAFSCSKFLAAIIAPDVLRSSYEMFRIWGPAAIIFFIWKSGIDSD
jgi:hypothetical protein